MSKNQEVGEFVVLINDEAQYSLWPAGRAVPAGWKTEGPRGDKEVCLAYIREKWTDMRPKSLRVALAEQQPS